MSDPGKAAAGRAAARLVEDGMTVGLGTGSTASCFVEALAARVREEGLTIRGVPTSQAAERLARQSGIPLFPLTETTRPDLTIDGADEADSFLNLIKGGGGALVREKLVAASSGAMIVVADESKLVATLGAFPLPVAIIPTGWETTRARIEKVFPQVPVTLRLAPGGSPTITDDGLHLLDLHFGPTITDPERLQAQLRAVVGVAEVGLFVGIASRMIVGRPDGTTFERTR
ncbi:MAG: ribose-5-phosphate isomerase RpiA [Cytophagales bacterium]|nr:ribose-5-phosphate isomerase RpiA [Armatimonadota bacterium]